MFVGSFSVIAFPAATKFAVPETIRFPFVWVTAPLVTSTVRLPAVIWPMFRACELVTLKFPLFAI